MVRSRSLIPVLALVVACTDTEIVTQTVEAPDTTAPIVLYETPPDGTTSVATNATVRVAFSETMDASSLTSSTFTLLAGETAVDGTVTASSDGRFVTFTPAAALSNETAYEARLTTDVADLAGNGLGAAVTFRFTTGSAPDVTPPTLVSVTPTSGATVSAADEPTVTATFSEAVDCAGLPPDALVVYEGASPVPGQLDCFDATVVFLPLVSLPTRASLVARISPRVTDVAGHAVGPTSAWGFDVLPWTRVLATNVTELGNAVATDAAGAAFVAGDTDGAFEGSTSAGDVDAFVVKYDASGTKVWTRQFGSSGLDQAFGVATDAAANVYVTGITFGDLGGNSPLGNGDAFLASYDASGAPRWSRLLGTGANDRARGVATDAAGHVFVTGLTSGVFDGNTSSGDTDTFIAMYDANGTPVWAQQFGSSALDVGTAVATDGSSNVYVAGFTTGGLDGNTSAGSFDGFLVKYDASGTLQWTRQFGTSARDDALGVATDSSGDIYVTGFTRGGLGGHTLLGETDVFIVKFDANGTTQWTRQFGTLGAEEARGVATDASGGVYVTGMTDGSLDGNVSAFSNDLFLVKYDTRGAPQWTRQFAGVSFEGGNGVATSAGGSIFVAGHAFGAFDGFPHAGSADVFVVRYEPDGRLR